MTLNSDAPNHNPKSEDLLADDAVETDRFELLSAYLDGELSPRERQQVQQWLDTDPQFKQLYHRLLKLHQGMQNLAMPVTDRSTEQLSEQVFDRISKQKKRTKLWTLTGGAIAALFAASMFSFWTNENRPAVNLAKSSSEKSLTDPVMVAVAFDKPAIDIPKAAITSSKGLDLLTNP
jgi:anti-sigma factor RsiW